MTKNKVYRYISALIDCDSGKSSMLNVGDIITINGHKDSRNNDGLRLYVVAPSHYENIKHIRRMWDNAIKKACESKVLIPNILHLVK